MIELLPVRGLPEIRGGDDLAALVVERFELASRDVVVVAQKAISKAEGRVVRIDELEASEKAYELAGDERDPREVEAVLREAKRIVRERGPLVIAETRHGFICASAGVDHSNAPEPGMLVLLPVDPDASARSVAPLRCLGSECVVRPLLTDLLTEEIQLGLDHDFLRASVAFETKATNHDNRDAFCLSAR